MERIPIGSILKWTGYPAFFLFCFVFFAYKTFPYERLADRLVQEAQAQGYELEIVDLTHSGLTGLTFENLRLVLPAEGDDSPPVDVIFEELTVSTSLFSLISDTKSYAFDAEVAGGEAEGDLVLGENTIEVDAELEDIDLAALPILRRFTKVPLAGTLNGEVELDMPSEVAESSGNVEITIEGLTRRRRQVEARDSRMGRPDPRSSRRRQPRADRHHRRGIGEHRTRHVARQGPRARRSRPSAAPASAQALRTQRDAPGEDPGSVQGAERKGGHDARAGLVGAQGRTDRGRRDSVHSRRLRGRPFAPQSRRQSAVRSAEVTVRHWTSWGAVL